MNMGGGNDDKIDGIQTVEPVFGIKAKWVTEKEKRKSRDGRFHRCRSIVRFGYSPIGYLKTSAYLIMEREGTQKLLDLIKDKNPTLVSELLPDLVNVGIIQELYKTSFVKRFRSKT